MTAIRKLALIGAAQGALIVSAMVPASAAMAQEAPVATQDSYAGGMADIVVTARKRTETLQDVPTTITAVGSTALESRAVTDVRALSGFVPNVTVEAATTSSSASQIFLRGIGIDNTGFNVDPTVGIYLDDVFVGRLIGSMLGAVDMERIEVLRGPQGSLYGRNSTAGAVKYVTKKPNLNDNSASLSATLGSYDRATFRGSLNLALVPGKLGLLVSAQSHKEDGYMRLMDANGRDTGLRGNARDVQDYRAALRYQPVDELTVDLVADYTHNRSGLQSTTPTDCGSLGTRPGMVFNSATGEYVPGNVSAGQFERCPLYYGDPYTSYIGPFDYNEPKYDSAGIAGTISYDMDFATVKSVTGYRGFRDVFASVLYGKPAPALQVNLRNRLEQRQFQQEFQISSNGENMIGYTAGLFYYYEDIDSDYYSQIVSGFTTPPSPRVNDDTQKTNSYAVYGEVYVRPLLGLEFTLGGRMSWDRKSVDRAIYTTAADTTPSLTYAGKIKASKFTPKLGVSYKFDDIMVFASYSEGYRAAGWANTSPSTLANLALEFDNETETSYEAGIKSQWFDRRLTLNLSAFSAKYENLQATLVVAGETVVAASDARIQGIELEGSLRPTRGLQIYGNLALMKDKYLTPPPGFYYAHRLKHLARSSFLIGADYETSLGNLPGTFFIGGDYRYSSSAFRNVVNSIDNKSDAFGLLGARAGYRSEDDRWSLTVGGSNLTDKVYYLLGSENQARQYQPSRRLFATFSVNL